jgi:hypothetical protein
MDLGKIDAPVDDKFLTELTSFDGFVLPTEYKELKKQIENLEVSERDVWICSFPRSGNHFLSLSLSFYVPFHSEWSIGRFRND